MVTLQIARESPLPASTIPAEPSPAVAMQPKRQAVGHAQSPRSQDGRAPPQAPLEPSGTASAANVAGALGSISSPIWCAILVGFLVYCAQQLRRLRVRLLPARSVVRASLHPRPG
jgi:hypothetical protein